MTTVEVFNKHVKEYEAWYEKYTEVYQSELIAIQQQLQKLPENIRGIEVGVGTGRFAKPLGIKEGVEPSEEMARLASKRGVEIIKGKAEYLPYSDLQFDFVLFVTICHLNNIKNALIQAHRVLKHKGSVIIGFIVKDKPIANKYIENKPYSTFFKNATFYSVEHIKRLLTEVGFKNLEVSQTLFGDLESIKEIQQPKEGSDEGSFVIIKATRK